MFARILDYLSRLRNIRKSLALSILIPTIAIAAVASADQIKQAIANSPYANQWLKDNAQAVANLAINVESGGRTDIYNGSCCYGVLQMNTANIRKYAGMSTTAYKNADLQTQVDAWAKLTVQAMKAKAPQTLSKMTTFDGRPVTGEMVLACVQLGIGHCQTMLNSGSCSGFADINKTTICKMADKMGNSGATTAIGGDAGGTGNGLEANNTDFHFFTRMFNDLSAALNSYVNDTATNVIDAITPVVTTLLALYVIFWGWSMIRGGINEPVTDAATRMIRIGVIIGIALQLGYYNGIISDGLWNTPDAMASYITGSDGQSNAEYLDSLWTQMYNFGNSFHTAAYANRGALTGMPDLAPWFTAYLLWAIGLAATGYGALLLALCKIALALLLGIGPLFIIAILFDATRKYFDAWIGQALNYVVLVILSAASLQLIFSVLETYLRAASGATDGPSLEQAIPAIVLSLIGVLVLMQMPSVAAGLSRGVATNTLGAVGWAYSKIRGAAAGTRDIATGKALSDMRGARRQRVMNARWAARNPSMPVAVYRRIAGTKS